jgi:hypothetical protein
MPLVNMDVVKQENQSLRPSVFWVVNTAYVGGWLQAFRSSLFVPSSRARSKTLEEGADNLSRNVGNKLQTFRNSLFVPSSTAKSKTLEEGADNLCRNVGNRLQVNVS